MSYCNSVGKAGVCLCHLHSPAENDFTFKQSHTWDAGLAGLAAAAPQCRRKEGSKPVFRRLLSGDQKQSSQIFVRWQDKNSVRGEPALLDPAA